MVALYEAYKIIKTGDFLLLNEETFYTFNFVDFSCLIVVCVLGGKVMILHLQVLITS